MDVETLSPGVDFVDILKKAVAECDVLLALIGPQWLTIENEKGQRRLDNPGDFVRVEIVTALERNVQVVPILLNGARMPEARDLPDPLKQLPRLNALEIRHERFNADTRRLARALERYLHPDARKHKIEKLYRQWLPVISKSSEPGEYAPRWIWPVLVGALLCVVVTLAGWGANRLSKLWETNTILTPAMAEANKPLKATETLLPTSTQTPMDAAANKPRIATVTFSPTSPHTPIGTVASEPLMVTETFLPTDTQTRLLPTPTIEPSATPIPTETPPPPTLTPTQSITLTASQTPSPQVASATPVPSDTPKPTVTPSMAPQVVPADELAFVSEIDSLPQIWMIRSDGSGLKQLTSMPKGSCYPTWFPDGKRLAFISPCLNDEDAYGGARLYIVDITSDDGLIYPLQAVGLAGDYDPDISPDGTKFAFVAEGDNNPEIYVMNLDGSRLTRITNDPGRDFHPTWSPDGAKLAFFSYRTQPTDIFTASIDGSGLFQFVNDTGGEYTPDWSPDGARIAFFSWMDGNEEIYSMNENGSNVLRLTTNDFRDQNPHWSIDGGRIAYEANPGGNWDIFIMNADGSNIVQLTDNDVDDTSAVWRPQTRVFVDK